MVVTFPLLNGRRIGFSSAQRSEENIIQRIAWRTGADAVTSHLASQSKQGRIASLVAHHLGIKETRCIETPAKNWLHGSFNVCLPVRIRDAPPEDPSSRLLLRVPMAHRLKGMVDEKMRCEVATYVWLQENCPDVRIPFLFAFGFPDGRHFTHVSLLPWYRRWTRYLRRRLCAWLGLPVPSYYIENPWLHDFPEGYLLLEFIHNGKPLALSWLREPKSDTTTQNLFRGISSLILALARVPLHRIGSFTFHNNGTISLTNRPLTCGVVILENDGAKRVMEAARTYESVEPYISDLLTAHDNRFISQQNAVNDAADCHYQMAIQMALRAVSHHYVDRDLRQGPFRMQFTDLHQGNLIVDEDWNITAIDEVCSPDHFAEYTAAREAFLTAFRGEDQRTSGGTYLSCILDEALDSGATWFFHSLDSVNAMHNLLERQLRPQFLPLPMSEAVNKYFAIFWSGKAREIAQGKLQDKREYDEQLRLMFQVGQERTKAEDATTPDADGGTG